MRPVSTLKAYAHLAPTAALFGGFIFDIFTLNRPDALFENVVMLGYLLLSGAVIILLQIPRLYSNDRKRLFLLSILQFSFGNLASALMILYAHSGTFAGSAIFIGMLAALFLGNEVLKGRYARNTLRLGIWFFLLLTYCALILPVLVHSIGMVVFGASVVLALVVMYGYLRLSAAVIHAPVSDYLRRIRVTIYSIAIIFVLLYLANFIPPVPLATKHMGIYHSVTKLNEHYVLSYEPPHWYTFWRDTNARVHVVPGSPVYCFSAVFAPGNLQTDIYHSWDRFDPVKKTWVTVARIPFPIQGGRAQGYRGYTYLMQLTNGQWRCRAEIKRGTALGQTNFNVQLVDTAPYTHIEKF